MDILVPLTAGGVDLLGIALSLKTRGMIFALITSMLTLYVSADLLANPALSSALNGGATFAAGDVQLVALVVFILTIVSLVLVIDANKDPGGYGF